jgi:hypothetical protein
MAGSTRRAEVDESARTSSAANTMIPARKATRWVGRSSGFMLSSFERMKPETRRRIYRTKVSTTPSYRIKAMLTVIARIADDLRGSHS